MTAHYSPSAYQPTRIPDQPAAVKRSWLFRFGSSRLPWGHTEDIVPHSMLSQPSPAGLRDVERYESALETGAKSARHTKCWITTRSSITNAIDMRHSPNAACSGFIYGGGTLCFLGDDDYVAYKLAACG